MARTGEYEPNDSTDEATRFGPTGSAYTAAIEDFYDVDMFEFFVAVDGSEVSFPVTNSTQGVSPPYSESIEAEIRDAYGLTVITTTDLIYAGASKTASYVLPAGRYYLVIKSGMSSAANLVRPYTFTVNGGAVEASVMQSICAGAAGDHTKAWERAKKAKRELRRADTPREARQARQKLKKARKAMSAAQLEVDKYCVAVHR